MATILSLSDDELLKLLKRLTLHADCKLTRLRWRGVPGGPAPRGVEAEDLAAEAITRVLDGTRAWDQAAQPDLLKHLRGVVDSLVSELVRSVDNRRFRRLDLPGADDGDGPVPETPGREPDPRDLAASREAAERFRAPIVEALRDDEVAYQVFECLEADITRPSEIAAYLGLPVSEINNAQKRLCRKAEGAMRPRKKGQPHG